MKHYRCDNCEWWSQLYDYGEFRSDRIPIGECKLYPVPIEKRAKDYCGQHSEIDRRRTNSGLQRWLLENPY